MSVDASKVAFVVATKDRPAELRRLLRSLVQQDPRPSQVVIVDASKEDDGKIAGEFPELRIDYHRAEAASAARQRNQGLRHVLPDAELIGFLDDDALLEPGALERMLRFWRHAPHDIGGALFNYANAGPMRMAWLKNLKLAQWLGLYGRREGSVARSGFHRRLGAVERDVLVDWLPTTACLWRREALDGHCFDPWFDGASYLEDLDFSYAIGRRWRLAIVAGARFYHYPAAGGRPGGFGFGIMEVVNRLYFVRKHNLSLWRCCLGIGIRWAMTLAAAVRHASLSALGRAVGNCVGCARSVLTLRSLPSLVCQQTTAKQTFPVGSVPFPKAELKNNGHSS